MLAGRYVISQSNYSRLFWIILGRKKVLGVISSSSILAKYVKQYNCVEKRGYIFYLFKVEYVNFSY